MSLKLKSILKRQLSWSVGQRNVSEEEGESRGKEEDRKTEIVPLRRKSARRRQRLNFSPLITRKNERLHTYIIRRVFI